jgi:hypothetical protein
MVSEGVGIGCKRISIGGYLEADKYFQLLNRILIV